MEHGLGLKITPAGSKLFALRKSIQGRVQAITLGHYGDISLEEARQRARTLNGQIASGVDPLARAKEARRPAEQATRSEAAVG